MNQKKEKKRVDGVFLLDKPVGLSSNTALQKVRRLLNAKKAGHTGTLDPLASGLLPLCFGEATKFSADLLDAEKEYLAEIYFGQKTETGDSEGAVVETKSVCFTQEQLKRGLEKFIGEIEQVPPMYSALKKNGVPLYKIARSGETIERAPRKVVISRMDLLQFDLPKAVIRVACSKGTYIRVLAEDIAQALGTVAHLTALRRVRVGDVKICDAVTLDHFEKISEEERVQMLAPVDKLISSLPKIMLSEQQTERFHHGQKIMLEPQECFGRVRVYGLFGSCVKLMGTAQLSNTGFLIPERLVTFEV